MSQRCVSLLVCLLFSIPFVGVGSEKASPDFKNMKPIDHANRIYSDGSKNYLVLFKDYYAKEADTFVEVPRPISGYSFISGQCGLNDVYDENITALVKVDLRIKKWRDVLNAWVVNPEAKTIKSISPTDVYCDNDAWGI